MKIKYIIILTILTFSQSICIGQTSKFQQLDFMLGDWNGRGSGFGNDSLTINSFFKPDMIGKYIEFKNESWFEPTSNNPEGEHHIDRGFISYDKARDAVVIRQFHTEGYVIQYTLADSLSNDTMLVFESESIENFVPGGKARWTIKKISDNQIETTFDVAFPNSDYSCLGVNKLSK